MNVAVGVAGWSYPDWNGFVYPAGVGDKLRFVSRYVDMIEINSTFYRPPVPRLAASWRDRTSDRTDFFFTAKLHRDITHGGLLEPGMVQAFHEGLAPLAEAGRLRHLLAQFPWTFQDAPASRQRVQDICGAFGAMAQVTFEFRHDTWQSQSALQFVENLGAGIVNLDCPTARHSFHMRQCLVGRNAYFRLHGRNAAAWFSRTAGRDETYNHLYTEGEIDEISQRARELAGMSATLTVVANNHYQGKELVAALQIKSRLSGRRLAVPELLRHRYPQMEDCADQGTGTAGFALEPGPRR